MTDKDSKKTRTIYTKNHKKNMVEDYKASDKSMAKFCQEDLDGKPGPGTLKNWIREYDDAQRKKTTTCLSCRKLELDLAKVEAKLEVYENLNQPHPQSEYA